MTSDHHIFDRGLLVRRRDRAAADAAAHEFLLARVADDFAERLSAIQRRFPVALDLGAYHGVVGRRLGQVPGVEMVISAEVAPRLLARCAAPRVRADAEALPFRDQSLDLVVSGLSLHLVNDLPGALVQIRRALKPDGLLLAALLGGDTLIELRNAFLAAEEEVEGGASPRVAPFADVADLGGLLQRAKFALPVVDADRITVTYPDALALMRELRAMGAANALAQRRRTPLRRRHPAARRRDLPGALRAARRPGARHLRDRHAHGLGAAREPAAAAAAGHGQGAAGGCAGNDRAAGRRYGDGRCRAAADGYLPCMASPSLVAESFQLLALVSPSDLSATSIPTATRRAIIPYSMEVAPRSSRAKRHIGQLRATSRNPLPNLRRGPYSRSRSIAFSGSSAGGIS